MAVLNIVKIGDPILRQKCREVKKINRNVEKLLDNMAETMYDKEGVGLAAPQVGIPKRIMIVDTGEQLMEFINPEIVEKEGIQTGDEGCLSVPGQYMSVSRPAKVFVKALNREGEEFRISAEGLLARAIVHEMDHLNGVLFVDLAEESVR